MLFQQNPSLSPKGDLLEVWQQLLFWCEIQSPTEFAAVFFPKDYDPKRFQMVAVVAVMGCSGEFRIPLHLGAQLGAQDARLAGCQACRMPDLGVQDVRFRCSGCQV